MNNFYATFPRSDQLLYAPRSSLYISGCSTVADRSDVLLLLQETTETMWSPM